jgi:hypothetical protein
MQQSIKQEIQIQLWRCEQLLYYIHSAEKNNQITREQKLHAEIQVLSLIKSLETQKAKTKTARINHAGRFLIPSNSEIKQPHC